MERLRTRGIRHSTQRDFDQERSDLDKGYENLFGVLQSCIDSTMSDDSISADEKTRRLEYLKAEVMQENENYQAERDKISAEEATYLEQHNSGTDYIPEMNSNPSDYCSFTGESVPGIMAESAEDYCGFASPGNQYVGADNDSAVDYEF